MCGREAKRPVGVWRKPIEAARLADPDPYRDRLRTILLSEDRKPQSEALKALAVAPEAADLPAPTAVLLGRTVADLGQTEAAVALLRISVGRHPADVWVNYFLAQALDSLRPSAREEAARYYTAARALRPETAHELAHLLERMGRGDEAEAVFRDLTTRRPDNERHLGCLGKHLRESGRAADAAPVLERAIAAGRASIRLKPDDAGAHVSLGLALEEQGMIDEAIAEFRAASRLKPDYAEAHANLGDVLDAQGKTDEAIAEFRAAIRFKPDLAEAHNNLGALLCDVKHDYAAAEAACEAIRLKPEFAGAIYSLGNALKYQGKLDEAIAEYREAIRLWPDYAEAHCDLGGTLQQKGDYAGALEMVRKGHELGSRRPDWRYPSAEWVAQAERKLALSHRFPAWLRGEDKPGDNAERLTFAQMCYDTKRFANATRLWAEALAADSKLGDDRQAGHRYNAACAAALAAAGAGKDEAQPDEMGKGKLRVQALDWLMAELAASAKCLDGGDPKLRDQVARTLQHWKSDTDLTGIRDREALTKLPEAERIAWQSLWADVEGLLKKARGGQP